METISRAAYSLPIAFLCAIVLSLAGAKSAQATLVPIVQNGDAAVDADLGINSTFLDIDPESIAISNAGTVSFVSTINQTVGGVATPSGTWRQVGSQVILVGNAADGKALEGQPAPGSGANFSSFDLTDVNSLNQVAFTAELDNGDSAIYRSNPFGTALSLLAQEGDAAPGIAGAFLGDLGPVSINGSGDIAFRTILTGAVTVSPDVHSNNDSLWRTSGGILELVARENDPLPGGASQR